MTNSWWLNETYAAVSRLVYSLHKTCTRQSLPHTVHLTCDEFLLVSLSLGIWAFLVYTSSEKVWHHPALLLMHTSRSHGHLPSSKCSAATNCSRSVSFFGAHIFQLHGVEPFLRRCQLCSYSVTSQCGSRVGWGTMLQARRSRVQVPMRSLDVFQLT
jgi:hypothetical protein